MKTKIALLAVTMVLFALPAIAETYTWEDDQGTVNFTEDLGKVPLKYRKKVKIVGEEEFPPPEAGEGTEKPAAKGRVSVPGEGKEGAPSVKQDKKKAVYGGRDAEAWKSEFGSIHADLKAAEQLLADYRNRLKDTGNMSRSEYLSIQNSIKTVENRLLRLRDKLDDLKREAEAAGVPADLME